MTPKSENDQSDLSLKIRPHFLFIFFTFGMKSCQILKINK